MKPLATLFKSLYAQGTVLAYIGLLLRRHRAIIAYLFLVAGIIFALASDQRHNSEARDRLAYQTRTVLVAGCERSNDTRVTLQGILRQNVPTVRQYVEEGTISEAQGERSIIATAKAVKKLRPVDCEAAYPIPVP